MADLLASAVAQSESEIVMSFEGLSQSQLQQLLQQSLAFCAAHGLMIGSAQSQHYIHTPFSLFPSQFPKAEFHKGVQLSRLFCQLVDRISRDPEWIYTTLETVVLEDEFTRRLVELSKAVHVEGIVQKASLGIFRSDYMLHQPDEHKETSRLLQVELNTIASSFGPLCSLTCDLHRFLMGRYSKEMPALEKYLSIGNKVGTLPANSAKEDIPKSLFVAHQHYDCEDAVIVFIVQPNEMNSVDQKLLEYELWNKYSIRVLRKTLLEMSKSEVRGHDRRLFIDDVEVSVVYFRAGYTPSDYPSENEWAGRTLIERSLAIKCPNITYHLAGTKKVQQALSDDVQLSRFIHSEDDRDLLKTCFAGLFGLEENKESTKSIIDKAIKNPSLYVLKPQREGGGNNFYGDDVKSNLQSMSKAELQSYILMDRIFPKSSPALLVRNGNTIAGNSVSELGMFGVCLFDDGKEILNSHAGHLLRTKMLDTDEGGVASGFAVLSSPILH